MIMNKTQLIDVVATKTGLKKKDAEAAVNAVNEAIVEALKETILRCVNQEKI